METEKTVLRARDFWTSWVLILVSLFFIWQTTDIPFFDSRSAGVDTAEWYDSAAVVPYAIFGCLLLLGVWLMVVSIRDGGASVAFSALGIGFDKAEVMRCLCLAMILVAYIFALIPRVDFVLSSALLITALIFGFHRSDPTAMAISTTVTVIAGLYAAIANFPQSQWNAPHDDDWVTLACLIALTLFMYVHQLRDKRVDRISKLTPVIAVLAPLLLVNAMAFGFRQNIPNRGGLIFAELEYHYYVNIRPLWQRK